MKITKEMQIQIFNIMTELIEKKGAKNKMVSIFDIHDVLKAQSVDTSKILIEAILDVLIQHKYVRYYRDARNYTYYGITQLGWTRWTAREEIVATQQQHVEQIEIKVEKKKRGRPVGSKNKVKESV